MAGTLVTLLVLGIFFSTATIYLSVALLGILLLLQGNYRDLHRVLVSLWPLTALALTGWLAIRIFTAQTFVPEEADAIGKWGGQLLIISGIPALLLAVHIRRYPALAGLIAGAYVFSAAVFLFQNVPLETIADYITGNRENRLFFDGPSNSIGAIYGLGSLFAIHLLHILNKKEKPLNPALRWPLISSILLCLTLFVVVLLFNQSRTAWLGFLAGIFPLLIHIGTLYWREPPEREPKWLAISLVAILAALLYNSENSIIAKRFQSAYNEISTISDIHIADNRSGSLRVRAQIWKAGILASLERPVAGWGPGRFNDIILKYNGDHLVNRSHFHNLFLQVLVALGLPGLIGFLILLGYPLAKGFQKTLILQDNCDPTNLLATSSLLFLITISLATIRHDDPTGQGLWIIVLGMAAAFLVPGNNSLEDRGHAMKPSNETSKAQLY